MITKEEFEKAVECCTGFTVSCENCPLSEKDFKCGTYLAEYIKNEPALSANSTSSTKKENTFQIDDSTKSDICQVLASAMSTLLALRQEMEPHEKKAFDLG